MAPSTRNLSSRARGPNRPPTGKDRSGDLPSLNRPQGSCRVVFTFDEKSYALLEELAEHFGSKAEAVRASLRLNGAVLRESKAGFKNLVLRNPDLPNQERVLIDQPY